MSNEVVVPSAAQLQRAGFKMLPPGTYRASPNKDWLRAEGQSTTQKPWLVWPANVGDVESARRAGVLEQVKDIKADALVMRASERHVCGDSVRSMFVETQGAAWVLR